MSDRATDEHKHRGNGAMMPSTDGDGGAPPPPSAVAAAAPEDDGNSFFDDMESVRINPNTTYGTRAVLTDLAVRKPDNQEWIRVHPGEDMQVSTGILLSRKQGSRDTAYYVVPELRDRLRKEIKPVTLFVAITSGGVPFLWPIGLQVAGGRSNSWLETARSGCEAAKTEWVRVRADSDEGQYETLRSTEAFPEPKWPDKLLKELLKMAFKDRIIDKMDHPVVVSLFKAT